MIVVRFVWAVLRWAVLLAGAACLGYAIGIGIDELRRLLVGEPGRSATFDAMTAGRPRGGPDLAEAWATAQVLEAIHDDPASRSEHARRMLERGTAIFDGRLAIDLDAPARSPERDAAELRHLATLGIGFGEAIADANGDELEHGDPDYPGQDPGQAVSRETGAVDSAAAGGGVPRALAAGDSEGS